MHQWILLLKLFNTDAWFRLEWSKDLMNLRGKFWGSYPQTTNPRPKPKRQICSLFFIAYHHGAIPHNSSYMYQMIRMKPSSHVTSTYIDPVKWGLERLPQTVRGSQGWVVPNMTLKILKKKNEIASLEPPECPGFFPQLLHQTKALSFSSSSLASGFRSAWAATDPVW